MESNISWSRIAGVLALIAQLLNFALVYFAHFISPEIAIGLGALIAAIQAFTGRIQGVNK